MTATRARAVAAKPTAADDDPTVKIVRTPPPPAPPTAPRRAQPAKPAARVGLSLALAGAFVVSAGVGTLGWVLWPRPAANPHTPAMPVPVTSAPVIPIAPPPATSPLEFQIATATEAHIRTHVATATTVFRFASNPNILVLDFASLRDQGLMLNRIGAFAEKATAPHDRVLTDAELDRVIQTSGDTIETFYYGHDYSAATVLLFFTLADRDSIRLNAHEETLRRLLLQEGWLREGKSAGLISVPRVGADARITADERATILHHELSHGEYFSNPIYAAYSHRFWTTVLTQAERNAVRKYLRSEAYDSANDELMENEAQAYLVFTQSPAFFTPAMMSLTPARRAELRSIFMRDIPVAWLRDDAAASQPDIAKASAK